MLAARRVAGAPFALRRAFPPAAGRRRPTTAAAASMMEKVTFGGDAALPGYEYVGGGAGEGEPLPAVVVLQEWWGVTPIIKDQAVMLADRGGFRVLVPDLYKGKVGVDAEEASHLMNHLDFKAAVGEVKRAVAHLRATGSPKVGVVGFCMGGALAFAAAQHAGVDAAAPFYGIPSPEICDPKEIAVPVQAHFGELDALEGFSDPASARKVHEAMKEAKRCPSAELFMYPGCGHAFMNALTEEGRAKIASIGAAAPPDAEVEAAMERVVAFFKRHLSA